jgi:hypothetical protein
MRQYVITNPLVEMPMGIGGQSLINGLISNIKGYIAMDIYPVEDLENNFKKLEGNSLVFYWYERKNQIFLGGEFHKTKYGLQVSNVAKINSKSSPFATDLYEVILNDRKSIVGEIGAIKLLSDSKMTEKGLSIWKRLLVNGHQIVVFDKEHPTDEKITLTSGKDMDNFFKMDDPSFARWIYMIIN